MKRALLLLLLASSAQAQFAPLIMKGGRIVQSNGETISVAGSINLPSATNQVSVLPLGNSVITGTSLNVVATTQTSANREYAATITLNATTGASMSPTADKAAIYAATDCTANCTSAWAINPLLVLETGRPANFIGGQIAEFDINNNSGTDYNTGNGPGSFIPPFASGISIASAGSNKVGAAIWTSSSLSTNRFQRGLLFTNNSIDQADIQDSTTSTRIIDVWGRHTDALTTLNGTISGSVVHMANGQNIAWRNSGNTADITVLVDSSNAIKASAPVVLPSYTVASLPSCGTAIKGALAYVTDATAPTYNGVLIGGGAVVIPVFCNGSSWAAH